jgi:hypothetical protein
MPYLEHVDLSDHIFQPIIESAKFVDPLLVYKENLNVVA